MIERNEITANTKNTNTIKATKQNKKKTTIHDQKKNRWSKQKIHECMRQD